MLSIYWKRCINETLQIQNVAQEAQNNGKQGTLKSDAHSVQVELLLEMYIKCYVGLFEQCDHMTPSDVTADLL